MMDALLTWETSVTRDDTLLIPLLWNLLMPHDNNSRVIVNNQQICEFFHRKFGQTGEKKPATLITTTGITTDTLHTLAKETKTIDVLQNQQTGEFYVYHLLGRLSTIPEATILYVNCKESVIHVFDQYYRKIPCLGFTIGHMQTILQLLTPQH